MDVRLERTERVGRDTRKRIGAAANPHGERRIPAAMVRAKFGYGED